MKVVFSQWDEFIFSNRGCFQAEPATSVWKVIQPRLSFIHSHLGIYLTTSAHIKRMRQVVKAIHRWQENR